MSITKPPIIVIGGPTASGKTDCGKEIAQKYNGVVISADSRQVYRGLDIGTGKDATFHQEMIDIVSPATPFTIADYVLRTNKVISAVYQARKIPVCVGGTGYYIDAVLHNASFPTAHNALYRQSLEHMPTMQLTKELHTVDPRSAIRVGHNRRRIIRALEIVYVTGKPVPVQCKKLRYDPLIIILDPGPDALRARIASRLDSRLQSGMIQEVEHLRTYVDNHWLRNLGLEYKYISDYLDGIYTYEQMQLVLYTAICAYARRQRTWFRRYPDAQWITSPDEAYPLVDNFIKRYTISI